MDQTAHNAFGTSITNKGYGTWGNVDKISVYSHYTVTGTYTDNSTYSIGTDWATSHNHEYKLYVRDYSDEDTSQEIYTYTMYRQNDNTNTPWVVFVPSSSSKIQFSHYYDGKIQGQWGYDTWNHQCPQQRPVKSKLYASNSLVYHFTANDSGDTNKTQGRGYWDNANLCYVIKAGWLWQSTIHDYMWWTGSTGKKVENATFANAPVVTATKDTSNENVFYQTSQVFHTEAIYPRGFKDIIFSNGYQGDNDKTKNLVLFAGCFYLPGNSRTEGKWLGSLNDTGRSVDEEPTDDDDDDTGTDIGGGSMSGYNTSTSFVFKINGTEYPAKRNDNGTDFKVRVTLSAGDNWTTVQKKEGNYPEYGNGQPGQYYVTKEDANLLNLTTANSNDFSIRAASAGNFIVAFHYENGNTNTIKVTSILKEGNS
jgi:hypothetical protein